MKIPEPEKTKTGYYYIRLRLGGQSIPVYAKTAKECRHEAEKIKSAYLADKRLPQSKSDLTLGDALERYITAKAGVLSPSTVCGYRILQRNRFTDQQARPIHSLTAMEWQKAVSAEAQRVSPKTLRNAVSLCSAAVKFVTGSPLPAVKLPGVVRTDVEFLRPDDIRRFVDVAAGTKYAVPLLLALSGLRISEIYGLDWKDIPPNAKMIRIRGAAVPDEHRKLVKKPQNKTATSSRDVPILIPALSAALERDRQPQGCVSPVQEWALRKALRRICVENGFPPVTMHGLRHSFASLCYHLQIPQRQVMELGGWSDYMTVQKIYTHIAQQDKDYYSAEIARFYAASDGAESGK